MASRNDITGAPIRTKAASKAYKDNWDAIFSKKEEEEENIDEQKETEMEDQDS